MIKRKRTKKGNIKVSGGMADFIDSVDMLVDGVNDPEFKRYVADIIAQYAVKLAKENVWNGGNPSVPHSKDTEYLTEKLSKGERTTQAVLMEDDDLYRAIKVTASTVSFGKVHLEIGVIDDEIAKYALIHEYGGNPGGAVKADIPARPYLIPAIREAAYSALENAELQRAINNALDAMSEGRDWRSQLRGISI
jgi:phage gpG-like protein